jgi:anti-anti-sigma factor
LKKTIIIDNIKKIIVHDEIFMGGCMTIGSENSVKSSTMQRADTSVCKLEINGDLAGQRVKKLEEEFAESLSAMTFKRVILNITTAQNIDSPGLALCVGLFKECQNKKIEFEIFANQDICKIFKLVNLDRVLPIKELH